MSEHLEAQLLRAMASARTLSEQAALAAELQRIREERTASLNAERDIEWADTVIRDTFTPVPTHVFHTAATDWMGEAEAAEDPAEIHTAMIAEAASWYARVSPEVKGDREEFREQAQGMARKVAGKHADAQSASKSFLDYVAFLMSREGASGLDQIQQTTAPDGVTNKPTQLPTEVFDNFAPEVAPENQGADEQVSSDKAPLIQEIMSDSSGMGTPEIPNSHTTTNTDTQHPNLVGGEDTHRDFTHSGARPCSNCASGNHSGTNGTAGCKGGSCGCNCQKNEKQKGEKNKAKPNQMREDGTTAALFVPSVALAYTANLDDFRAAQRAEIDAQLEESPNFSLAPRRASSFQDRYSDEYDPDQGGYEPADHYEPGDFEDKQDEEHEKPQPHHVHRGSKTGASGLDQIQQTIDPNNTPKTTPIPGEVMFPINENWNNDRPHGGGGQQAGDTSAEGNSAHSTGNTDTAFRGSPSNHENLQGPQTQPYQGQPTPGSAGAEVPDGHSTTNTGTEFKKVPSAHKNLASVHTADMFGNSDLPHQTPNPNVPNSDATTPQMADGSYESGYAAGKADAEKQDAPTFADGSSHARPYVQGYGEGFEAGFPEPKHDSMPFSMRNMSSADPDYVKGFNFASRWTPNSPLVATGSVEFEAGLYEGIKSNAFVETWVAQHRAKAPKFPYLAARLDRAKMVTAALQRQANQYIQRQGDQWVITQKGTGKVLSHHASEEEANASFRAMEAHKHGMTSTDLDTHTPAGSASPAGNTPFNGPGQPPPLEGGTDPAASGGAAPYNGANPSGHSVVPGVDQKPKTPHPGHVDRPGQSDPFAEVSHNTKSAELNPQLLAFRQTVQANLLREAN